MEFLKRYWRGEFPLKIVFWNGLSIGISLAMPMLLLKHTAYRHLRVLGAVLHLIFLLVWSIGLWKSTKNYTGNKIWKTLAQLYSIAVWLGFGVGICIIIQKILLR